MELEYYYIRKELARKTNAPYGVGSFTKGNILLIGEQASDPTNAPEQEPFCSSKGCSGWINKLFQAESIPEDRLFWVNALDNSGNEIDLKTLVCDLQPSSVISLGKVAKSLCEKTNVEHISVYHPQYWKRFRSKERYPLIDLLNFLLKS